MKGKYFCTDILSSEFYQILKEEIPILWQLLGKIKEEGSFPKLFNKTSITQVWKKGKID